MKPFTLHDYLDALHDGAGRRIGPKQTEMVLRRAREDANITLKEYAVLLEAAHEEEGQP